MQKLTKKLECAQEYVAFLQQGGRVAVIPAAKPRKEERWLCTRYSIANMGRLKSRLSGFSSVDSLQQPSK
jgi:hypothetical protein